MKLYWCPQTRSFRAFWLMEDAGRPYERAFVDIQKGDRNAAAFRAVNPMGKVPVLAEGRPAIAAGVARRRSRQPGLETPMA